MAPSCRSCGTGMCHVNLKAFVIFIFVVVRDVEDALDVVGVEVLGDVREEDENGEKLYLESSQEEERVEVLLPLEIDSDGDTSTAAKPHGGGHGGGFGGGFDGGGFGR